MDRFIVPNANETEKYNKALKSNMDRFIDMPSQYIIANPVSLKSNMDRFIAVSYTHLTLPTTERV